MPKKTALIVSGAVSQGAFEAGVLEVLAANRERLPIARLAGASSGALNCAVYATGIRFGKEVQAATNLVTLWQDDATWNRVADWSLKELLQLDGLATSDKVLKLLARAVEGCTSGDTTDVDLRLTLTALDGAAGKIGNEDATTFEYSKEFSNAEFDTEDGREKVFDAAAGSSAFPGLFAPRDVAPVGPCVDGGAVNNAPIGWALQDGSIEQIIVVSAHTRGGPQPDPPKPLHGPNLLGHLVDILVNERLYRDLREAAWVNSAVERLRALDGVPRETVDRVLAALSFRPVDIVEIRPLSPLEGNTFSGFSERRLRDEYIDAGRQAAQDALKKMPL